MKKKLYFCSGELAEWSIAAVLKTVDLHGSGGSNPSLSANKKAMLMHRLFHFCKQIYNYSNCIRACVGSFCPLRLTTLASLPAIHTFGK